MPQQLKKMLKCAEPLKDRGLLLLLEGLKVVRVRIHGRKESQA